MQETLAVHSERDERLAADENIPPFEKPEPPKVDYLEYQRPLDGRSFTGIPAADLTPADIAFRAAMEREERMKA
jgi:hypothetical protein